MAERKNRAGKKLCGDKYLEAEARFKRRHATDKRLIAEVDQLTSLLSIWCSTVALRIMTERFKGQI